MSQIEELARLAAEQDELLKERDATVSTAVWRIQQLETVLGEILDPAKWMILGGRREAARHAPKVEELERWRAILKG